MKIFHIYILTIVALVIFFSSTVSCKKKDLKIEKTYPQNKYSEIFSTHPSGDLNLYDISKSWNNRIYPLDEVHKDYVLKMNQLDGFSESPTSYKKMNEIRKVFQKISIEEPIELKRIKNKYIYGIYIVSNLGGTGLTGFIFDGRKSMGGFILIDGDLISRKANQWITAKESSVFQEALNSKINIKIASNKDNTIETAMEYILLHELGHIIAQSMNILPDQRDKYRKFDEFEFSKKVWIDEENSIYDESIFRIRKELQFYDDESIFFIDKDSLTIYNQLEKTSFPTLYSAMNPDDHFAESFVSYIHLYLYKHPWELQIDTPKLDLFFKNGITLARCSREKEFIKKLLIDCKKNLK